ncbi:MAG: B12-binding domain-containing radical SAM protein [Desulfobacteraceae bacterium]|nr:B12-binding domain-containing radical SAM protein [Desulfobacteraceae bacterium]
MPSNKILLIHPLGYAADKARGDVSRMANIMPPLGLASLAAVLDRERIPSHIIDCYCHPASEALILDYIRTQVPGFVGFSCTTSSFLDGLRIAALVKAENPDIRIVFGGPHVSALRESLMEAFEPIDYLIVGEGETALTELLTVDTAKVGQIPGLVYRSSSGKIVFTGFRKKLLNLDTLPFPAYDKLAGYPHAYKLPIFNYPRVPNASCISSRGCPYTCSYCDRSVFRRSFRYNSAEYLFAHMEYLHKTFNIRHINFYDDQFTFHRERVAALCRKIINRGLNITFNCAARAEHLDPDLLRLMKAAGCWMISLGIETGDPDLLARHRQNPDLEMLRHKVMMIQKTGIRIKALLMMGLPGETEASIRKSRDYVFSLPVDDINLAKFTPFPGSPVYEDIKSSGSLMGTFEEDWEKMDCMNFSFIPRQMTIERLDELFIDFYRTHFMRFPVLLGYLSMIWKSPDSWRRMLADLSGFLTFAKRNKRMKE